MNRRIFCCFALLSTVLFSIGCSSNNKGKLEGTKWSSLATTVNGMPVPAGTLKLEFGADKSLVYRTSIGTFNGTYSLGMGDNVTLKLDRDLAGRRNHTEKITVNGDRLAMRDSDGTSVTFERMK